MPKPWDVLHEEVHADCKIYQVYKQHCRHSQNGKKGDFYVIKADDWVQALPLTEDGRLIMVRQYRFGLRDLFWEVPGGMLHCAEGPIMGARRELREETGYDASSGYEIAMAYPNPAIQSNKTHFVLLRGCTYQGEPSWDTHEEIQVSLMPLDEVFRMVDAGAIKHLITLNALFFLKSHLESQS